MAALSAVQKRALGSYPPGTETWDTTDPTVIALKIPSVTAYGTDGRNNVDIAASDRPTV